MVRVAKAKHHNARGPYGAYVSIGKKQFDTLSLVEMWNEVPAEIRKQIQDKYESDY